MSSWACDKCFREPEGNTWSYCHNHLKLTDDWCQWCLSQECHWTDILGTMTFINYMPPPVIADSGPVPGYPPNPPA